MKTLPLLKTSAARLLIALLVVGLAPACDDSPNGVDEGELLPIVVAEIIIAPKSPAPGDTATLTAIVTTTAVDEEGNPLPNPGPFPDVAWSVTGGNLLESTRTTVRWVAPLDSRLYTITCQATNPVNSSQASVRVFVGETSSLVESEAGQIWLEPNETDFYYLRTSDVSLGAEVWRYANGSISDPVPGEWWGYNVRLSPQQTHASYDIMEIRAGAVDMPFNVWLDDFASGTRRVITFDQADPTSRFRDQYRYAEFSPNNELVVYQGRRPHKFFPTQDSIDVFIYHIANRTTECVTLLHGVTRRANFFPTISPDGSWLVFVSNRVNVLANVWDFYGVRMAGNTVESTDSSATVQLSNTGGVVVKGTAQALLPPPMSWNPNPATPVLAFQDDNDNVYLMAMGPSGATVTEVTGFAAGPDPRQFLWSHDGQVLAVTTGSGLYTADLSGAATLVQSLPSGDNARDLRWSPDGDWLLYRVQRAADTWFELLDVAGGRLEEPAVLTPAKPAGSVSTYARVMDMGGAFTTAHRLLLLEYPSPLGTPGVVTIDVSGVTQP